MPIPAQAPRDALDAPPLPAPGGLAAPALSRLCGLIAAALALFWGAMIPLSAPWEYAEGDCATWIWMLRHGEPLYGPATGLAMRKSNYPPLYLQAAAWLSPSDAAILTAGRLISLAGFALAVAMISLAVRRATGSVRAAAIAAALLGGSSWFGLWGAICRPDALAIGLGAAGVTCAALRVRGWPLVAALCFAASLMAKHSLIVFPVGTVGWALFQERQRGYLLAAATAGLVFAAVALGGLWDPLVRNSIAGWEPLRFLENTVHYAAPLALGVALSTGLVARWPQLSEEGRRVAGPWLWVLAVGLAWTVSLGRVGASCNYTFELACAVSVLAPLAVVAGGRSSLLVGHAAVALGFTLQSALWQLAVTRPRAAAEMAAARQALTGVAGDVLSEQSAYALPSGRPAVVVPFLAAQLSAAGRWDARPLEAALRRGEISRVLLQFSLDDPAATRDGDHHDRLPDALLSAVRDRYRLVRREGELHIYGPR